MKRPLTIFVPHCSDLLTDHLPHGDGLIAHGFISHLARRGHCIHVAAQQVDLREPLGPNVSIHPIPGISSGRILWRVAYMRSLRRLFWRLKKEIRFDVIHQLNPVFTGLSFPLVGSGLPLVLGAYAARWPDDGAGTGGIWTNWALARARDAISALQQYQADALVLTTPAAKNRLPIFEGVRDRLHFLPHGIDTAFFSPTVSPSLSKPSGTEKRSILFFANVVRRKGIFTLIDAFSLLASELSDVTLRIAGDGPDLPEAGQRVARLTCAHRVEFLGRQERANAPKFYRDCTICCLPSFGEPFAGTLLEAMSCGKPIVSTDTGGTPHLVTERGGILVRAGDAVALSRALRDLLTDPIRCAAMGRSNREMIESSMSWERVTEQLERIYEKTIQNFWSKRRDDHRNRTCSVSRGSETSFQERV
jgi:L-malate glycosyltransferase